MVLRRYRTSDCKRMAKLFYETVHSVNAADYTEEQLDAWATGNVDLAAWDKSFLEHFTIVAEDRRLWRYRQHGLSGQALCTERPPAPGYRVGDLRRAGECGRCGENHYTCLDHGKTIFLEEGILCRERTAGGAGRYPAHKLCDGKISLNGDGV